MRGCCLLLLVAAVAVADAGCVRGGQRSEVDDGRCGAAAATAALLLLLRYCKVCMYCSLPTATAVGKDLSPGSPRVLGHGQQRPPSSEGRVGTDVRGRAKKTGRMRWR